MITITALPSRVISIGRLGENEHRHVAFDISEYLAQYPDATFGLIHSPSGVTAYPVATVAVENDQLIWTVTSSDVTAEGQGRCELIVRQGDTIAKSIIYMTQVLPALDATGEAPEPWESWQAQMIGIAADVDASADRAEAASDAVQNLSVTAETMAPGAEATVEKYIDETGAVTLAFGIPTGPQGPAGEPGQRGPAGQDGQAGPPGANGFSPVASVSKTGSTATITITDKTGTTTATVNDGAKGDPGDDYIITAQDKADIAALVTPEPVMVSGSTPSITATANTRYICGTVTTLTFTPSASGICDVRFTSGSIPTVLTVPNTVLWPDWFDPTALDANTTYELNVLDSTYGAVGVWS